MALQDDIAADQQAISDAIAAWKLAESAVSDAQAKLAADQAKLDALQPHQSVLAEIEAKAAQYGDAAVAEFAALTARLKALLGL